MNTSRNLKGSGGAFLAVGIAFIAIGVSRQPPFIAIGAAFIAMGTGLIAQSNRSVST